MIDTIFINLIINRLTMYLFAFGMNHHQTPVSIRERVAFPAEVIINALQDLRHQPHVEEAAILSTCNRMEIYCHTAEPKQVIEWLCQYHQLSPEQIQQYLYTLPNDEAVKHAFRVASGLDSMVLGEAQILGQMKQAVRCAEEAGTLGTILYKLFQNTFAVAKKVRTQTAIGTQSVSMAAAAVKIGEQIFGKIADQKVLFIGAGEMIELCVTHFHAQQPQKIMIANRTMSHAQALATRFGVSSCNLQDLNVHLAAFDIIVTSTGSALPILGKGLVQRALKQRKSRPMLFIDLAVPRDIEPEVSELSDAFLYTVDDLAQIVQNGVETRQAAVLDAEVIIDHNVTEFMHWVQRRETVPVIRMIHDYADRQRRHELERAQKRLAKGEDPEKILEEFSRALTNKLIHPQVNSLNQVVGHEQQHVVRVLNEIYHTKH